MSETAHPRVTGLLTGGPATPWHEAGFAADAAGFAAGTVAFWFDTEARTPRLLCEPGGAGLDGASLAAQAPVPTGDLPGDHPNAVTGVDHVVVATPDIERSRNAFTAERFELRRTRSAQIHGREVLQCFYVAGDCLIELVGPAEPQAGTEAPASVWGVTFVTQDLDSLPALNPPPVASIGEAVQPGRRIAVAREELALPLRVAFMDPRKKRTRQ